MDLKTCIYEKFRENFRPILMLVSGLTLFYIASKLTKKCKNVNEDEQYRQYHKGLMRSEKIPSISDIQKFIEELPLDVNSIESTNQGGLKELLEELTEFSDDEEWRDLVNSLQKFYEETNNI